ncbi:MAG TPA: CZB domain-containing protein [Thiobacillus sp.]|nr:MAG: hypothetical protein B7Y50_01945 [Hydrogenophilales bacterium 28-61-11]OYZ58682.1 MAG: hypothetical protein B7Y21_02045 [Hydrogenophilales bacterium 16-61-112]OZA45157.1 MAG: hypothetical protein B7X81_08840 [Hydrogenophilales bacterium 17-61-76]HQT69590.1 CZB domain-containing protein [Thiobacillus sp.]
MESQVSRFSQRQGGLTIADISLPDACELGIWLNNGARRKLLPKNHAQVHALHGRFHQVAGEIVQHIKQKEFSAARQSLASGGNFDRASHEMRTFLRKRVLHERFQADMPKNEGASTAPGNP